MCSTAHANKKKKSDGNSFLDVFDSKSLWHTSWLAQSVERLGGRELCQGSLDCEVGGNGLGGWTWESKRQSVASISLLARRTTVISVFSLLLFFPPCWFYASRTTQGRLGRLPNDSRKIPPSYCFTYFHLLLAWPLGSLLAHARPTDISDFTGSRPGSAGDGFVISNRLGGVDSYIAGFQEQLLLQISSSDATKTSSRVSFFILQGNVHLELRRESLLLRQRIDYHIVCFISKINV